MARHKTERDRQIEEAGKTAIDAIRELVLVWKAGAQDSPSLRSDAWGRLHSAELMLLSTDDDLGL
jgi:hypothetical protein